MTREFGRIQERSLGAVLITHFSSLAKKGAYVIKGATLLAALSAIAGFGLHQAGVSPFDACRFLDWKVLTGGLILLGMTVGGELFWRHRSKKAEEKRVEELWQEFQETGKVETQSEKDKLALEARAEKDELKIKSVKTQDSTYVITKADAQYTVISSAEDAYKEIESKGFTGRFCIVVVGNLFPELGSKLQKENSLHINGEFIHLKPGEVSPDRIFAPGGTDLEAAFFYSFTL